jgi:hypothetical protein
MNAYVRRATAAELRERYATLFTQACTAHAHEEPGARDADNAAQVAAETAARSRRRMQRVMRDDEDDVWTYWNAPALFAREHPGVQGELWELLYFSRLAEKDVV